MRQIPVKCNQELIKSAVRLDGRNVDEHRPLNISFGPDFGCCLATIGNTKVITQISSTIVEPRLTRPSEGIVNIRVDLSLLGSTNYDTSRNSEDCVELTRLLHKGIKDARCIDLETLCIISGEKVWSIQADVIIMNHEGNLIEAASISTLAALAHYRRPDVGVEDGQVVNKKPETQGLISFSMLHFPFLMKFAFFKEATISYVDPSEDEERFCDGYLIVGANIFKDITLLHISGKSLISKDQIIKQCNYAVKRTRELNEVVKRALYRDELERQRAKKERRFYKGNIYEVLAKVHS
jgi:exosome complex component RRP45